MIKVTTLKTEKHSSIIYNQGYLAIDGNYIIAAYLVMLDNPELQKKVLLDEPFAYSKTSGFLTDIPELKKLIPAHSTNQIQLIETDLTSEAIKGEKAKVFYNPADEYFTFFNQKYLEQFTKTGLQLKLYQTEKQSGAGHYNPELECLFYIMPMILRSSFLEKNTVKVI